MLLNFISMKEIDLANSEAEAIYVIEDYILKKRKNALNKAYTESLFIANPGLAKQAKAHPPQKSPSCMRTFSAIEK